MATGSRSSSRSSGEHDQFGDQVAELARLCRQPVKDLCALVHGQVAAGALAVDQQFDVGAQAGQRRAEFVGGVVDQRPRWTNSRAGPPTVT